MMNYGEGSHCKMSSIVSKVRVRVASNWLSLREPHEQKHNLFRTSFKKLKVYVLFIHLLLCPIVHLSPYYIVVFCLNLHLQ